MTLGKRFNFVSNCKFVLHLLLLMVSVLASSANACVTSFSEFEKATIVNASNVEALAKAFYQVNRPFPLSVQVVYHINSTNGTDTISTDPSCPPGKEVWLWVPSPVFLFINPTKLNLYALYTLNYFSYLWPPVVNITVPKICNTSLNQFSFLSDFTMRVSITVSILGCICFDTVIMLRVKDIMQQKYISLMQLQMAD